MPETSDEHYTARFYRKQVLAIAARLRGTADEIERLAEPRATAYIDGTPRFAVSAEQVVHRIIWDLANCSLDGLIHAASQADLAEMGEGDD